MYPLKKMFITITAIVILGGCGPNSTKVVLPHIAKSQPKSQQCTVSSKSNGLFPINSDWTLEQQVEAIRCNPPGDQIGMRLAKLLQIALKFNNPPQLVAELGFALSTAPINYIKVQIDWLRESGVSEAMLRNAMTPSRLSSTVKNTIEDQLRTYDERTLSCQQKIIDEDLRLRGQARDIRLAGWRQFTISTPVCLAAAARKWCESGLDFADETNFEAEHLRTSIKACSLSIQMGAIYWPESLQKLAAVAATHASTADFIEWAKIIRRMRIIFDNARWNQFIAETISTFAASTRCDKSQIPALQQAWEATLLPADPAVNIGALFTTCH